MSKRYYRGTIRDHFPMKSSNKGTDGLEFVVDLDQVKVGDEWGPMGDPITRRVWLWFPRGKSHELSLKKLRFAGWNGGSLGELDLVGKEVEVEGTLEKYNGEDRERFDFPLPRKSGGFDGSDRSEEAGLAIDAILQSAPTDLFIDREADGGGASEVPESGDDEDTPF